MLLLGGSLLLATAMADRQVAAALEARRALVVPVVALALLAAWHLSTLVLPNGGCAVVRSSNTVPLTPWSRRGIEDGSGWFDLDVAAARHGVRTETVADTAASAHGPRSVPAR